MSNWICDKCGATYIDVSHQEPSVLKQEIEIRQLKELLKECRDVAEFTKTIVNKHKWFDEVITKIDEVLK